MAKKSSDQGSGLHILVFPYPAQGHILPILDLTHQLALRGLAITVVVTPKNVPILNPLLSVHPTIQVLVFPFPDHPTLPPGVENVRDIGNHGNGPIIAALSKLQDPLVKWFRSQINNNPPVAIVSDFFLGWTQNVAHQMGIPRICFYLGAFLTAILKEIWLNFETIRNTSGDVKFNDLPSSPCFPYEHLPSVFRRYQETNPDSRVVRDSMIANISSWASIFNTFDFLEGGFSEYLKESTGQDKIFQVGPLNLMGVRPNNMGHRAETSGILKWLDECEEDESVLYVCFGSQKFLKKAQMEALANGLQQSGVRFIWVTKPVTAQQIEDGYASVPDGFEDRVSCQGCQGLVVQEWAPQVEILSHRAVGGFLSHCGWNSVMEAVTAGVMIIGWPMEADQFINAKLVVDYLGAAVRVSEGADTVPDSVDLAQKINESMRKDKMERVKAKELKKKAFEAIGNGGSSTRDMDGLVSELVQLTRVSSEEEDLLEEMVPIPSNGVTLYAK